MPRTRIHVRRDRIACYNKQHVILDALGVETRGMKKRYGVSVEIHGPSRLVYRPDTPLRCGAKAWLETDADVTVYQKTVDATAKA